jgi:hypothetical protein
VSRWPNWPLWAVGVVGVWLVLVIGVEIVSRSYGTSVVICPMKRFFGLPCPTCGSTRAGLAMLSGHPVRAWLWNPLMVTLGIAVAIVLGVRLATGYTLKLNLTRREKCLLGAVFLLALAANWVYLLHTGV